MVEVHNSVWEEPPAPLLRDHSSPWRRSATAHLCVLNMCALHTNQITNGLHPSEVTWKARQCYWASSLSLSLNGVPGPSFWLMYKTGQEGNCGCELSSHFFFSKNCLLSEFKSIIKELINDNNTGGHTVANVGRTFTFTAKTWLVCKFYPDDLLHVRQMCKKGMITALK